MNQAGITTKNTFHDPKRRLIERRENTYRIGRRTGNLQTIGRDRKGIERLDMEELLQILRKVKPGVDFEGKTDLFESGVLDSMTIVMLAAEINDEFDIDIQVTDIVPENFNSAESILAMIRRHQEEDD